MSWFPALCSVFQSPLDPSDSGSCKLPGRKGPFITLLLLAIMIPASNAAQSADSASDPRERIRWWEDAKFGLFIHWGPVSIEGTEIGWSRNGRRRGYWKGGGSVPIERYDTLFKEFNPTAFDPSEWVSLASEAGMKYLVFTTRHHDGFSLWDTSVSDYRITSPESPYGKDIVGPLAEATRAGGLRFGTYYSQPDWRHPHAFTRKHDLYKAYLFEQVRELMSRYGRVDILWFDGLGKSAEDYGAEAIHRMARELQPHLLINNRNGLPEDFDTPEQRVGTMQLERPWESCITLGQQWAWKPNDILKSADDCVRILVSTVTGGGNLLFNIGPMPDGRIEPRQADILREIGAWLRVHGSSIYGTRGGPFRNGTWGGSTHAGNRIYVHILQAPVAGRLRLPSLPQRILKATRFVEGTPVVFSQSAEAITLDLGADGWRGPVTVLALETDEPVEAGQMLGLPGGTFEDVSLYGRPVQAQASAVASSGEASLDAKGGWSVKTQHEGRPSLTLDLGESCLLTAFSASPTEHDAMNSNADLELSVSGDGVKWETVYRASYGLPQWEVPITEFVAGIHHPGKAARYVRILADHGKNTGTLRIGSITLHAR